MMAGRYLYTRSPGVVAERFVGKAGPCILCGGQTDGFGVWTRSDGIVTFYRYDGCGSAEQVEAVYWKLVGGATC